MSYDYKLTKTAQARLPQANQRPEYVAQMAAMRQRQYDKNKGANNLQAGGGTQHHVTEHGMYQHAMSEGYGQTQMGEWEDGLTEEEMDRREAQENAVVAAAKKGKFQSMHKKRGFFGKKTKMASWDDIAATQTSQNDAQYRVQHNLDPQNDASDFSKMTRKEKRALKKQKGKPRDHYNDAAPVATYANPNRAAVQINSNHQGHQGTWDTGFQPAIAAQNPGQRPRKSYLEALGGAGMNAPMGIAMGGGARSDGRGAVMGVRIGRGR